MANHLHDHLEAVRAALLNECSAVVLRATLPPGAALPAAGQHVVIDLIPGAPANDFGGTIYEDLILQVGCWDDDSLVSALTLAEAVRVRMTTLGYVRTGGTQLPNDEEFRGVVATYTLAAAFNQLT